MPTVSLPRTQNGAEPQRLLTTLLGDYWYWRDEHIPSAALVRLLGEFGITVDGARAAMRRLHARGLLTIARAGRTTAYGIPERTSAVIISRTHHLLSFGARAPVWDGKWSVVAFSVSEEAREARAALRAGLRLLHFAPLYDGLWVSPHDRVPAVLELLHRVGIATASVLRATESPGSPPLGSPAGAFDLGPLQEAYLGFALRYEPLLEDVRAGRIGPAEALVTRTRLRVDWRDFPDNDPDLPAELLPQQWARPRARRCFTEIYDALGPLAELRFRQILAVDNPHLADLASHHDSRQVAQLFAELGEGHAQGDTPFERARQAEQLTALGAAPRERRRRADGRRSATSA